MSENTKAFNKTDPYYKYKAPIYLASLSGISLLVGFMAALAAARKRDPRSFDKGTIISTELRETGTSLAFRALRWGTFYAFTGCSLLFYGIWKLSGATDLKDFRDKVGSVLPRIPKNDPPQGRTTFSGLNDLLEYLQSKK